MHTSFLHPNCRPACAGIAEQAHTRSNSFKMRSSSLLSMIALYVPLLKITHASHHGSHQQRPLGYLSNPIAHLDDDDDDIDWCLAGWPDLEGGDRGCHIGEPEDAEYSLTSEDRDSDFCVNGQFLSFWFRSRDGSVLCLYRTRDCITLLGPHGVFPTSDDCRSLPTDDPQVRYDRVRSWRVVEAGGNCFPRDD